MRKSTVKIEGTLEIVFWAIVGLLVGSALGMVWHFTELTMVLSGGVIFGIPSSARSRCESAD
jgi:hypothetical protein